MAAVPTSADETREAVAKLRAIRDDLMERYLAKDKGGRKAPLPWVVAYSGGKDSTLVLHLVFEMLLSLPAKRRKRAIHVVSNDTLVESPLLIDHLRKNLDLIRQAASAKELPVEATLTRPAHNQTFWFNLIGKGYMPPTRNFRWCTDKMKILPTTHYLKRLCQRTAGAILLIGTRKAESTTRKRSIEKRQLGDDGMTDHGTIKDCRVLSPIVDLSDDQVWHVLLQAPCHWGGSHREMVTIYRNARGGECPTVLSKDDAPSCGSTSPRFGCWTCTVVQKDRSLEGLVEAGYDEFEAMVEFRNMLQVMREDKGNRMTRRRHGAPQVRPDGTQVLGPFTLEARKFIYDRLLELQGEIGRELITVEEQSGIMEEWEKDRRDAVLTTSFRDRLRRKAAQLESARA